MNEVQELRAEYETHRRALEEAFLADGDADRYLRMHTDHIDGLVRRLAEPALARGGFCLLATAGYGRREQFPHSDVDLLVVHDLDEDRAEGIIAPFLNALWDTRLNLGHQVWSLAHLQRLTLDDFEFVLALFNSRIVVGVEDLGLAVLEEIHPRFVQHHRSELLERILAGVRARHEQFSNTIYQLEPDVKEAPGGLRDHLAATWLQRLVGEPRFLSYSPGEVRRAHRFLKRVRILLHLFHRRADNRLTHPMQEKLAGALGFVEPRTEVAVERLMQEYFLNARAVSGFCAAMLHAARPEEVEHPLGPADLPPLHTLDGVLEAFRISLEEGRPLSTKARSLILDSVPRMGEGLHLPDLRNQILDLFRPRPGLYHALSQLYELGVLELLFPEFSTIKARVIRDFYHKYTVDEHTLMSIRIIEDLATGESSSDPRFASVLRDTVNPSHLTLSLLLHDVGKSREGRHAEESARMASRALRRFRFDADTVQTVGFLIRQHLAMSAVIFRRDLEDDEVIRRFADLVGDPERLRLLTLLTYADIKAVAPGTLNDWKKDLLWQLYLETYRKLTLEYGEHRIAEASLEQEAAATRLLEELEPDIDRADFERFLDGFPSRYLTSTPPREIYEHFRMCRRISPVNPVESHLSRRKSYYELCVVTPDRKRLFAKIVGLLSYFEMNILRGFGFANQDQTILDIFQFSDERKAFRHAEERERFQDLLHKAVVDEVSVRKLLQGKEQSILFRRRTPDFEPSLYFEDEESERYSILEIIAPDALGLLFRISTEIAELGIDIDLALISTEGYKAVDVFYLSHGGSKLSSALKADLSRNIIQSITRS